MTHDGTTFGKTYTDDGNQIFNPSERVAYANSLDIDYYISIHVNSYDKNPDTSGIRIYYENGNNWRKANTNDENNSSVHSRFNRNRNESEACAADI